MAGSAPSALLELLKIPPRPEPPPSAPGSARIFRAARGYLRYSLLRWGLAQLAAAWGLAAGVLGTRFIPAFPFPDPFGWFDAAWGTWWVEGIAVLAFLVQLPLTLVGVVLAYRLRWYIVTDRSLRIREGIVRLKEKTMSFANIQNLSVQQGPLQRFFGISDLQVRSAGGGEVKSREAKEKGEAMHLVYFRGVENAEEIRELIVSRLRELQSAPTTASEGPVEDEAADPLAAARELLEAARQLHRTARRASPGIDD